MRTESNRDYYKLCLTESTGFSGYSVNPDYYDEITTRLRWMNDSGDPDPKTRSCGCLGNHGPGLIFLICYSPDSHVNWIWWRQKSKSISYYLFDWAVHNLLTSGHAGVVYTGSLIHSWPLFLIMHLFLTSSRFAWGFTHWWVLVIPVKESIIIYSLYLCCCHRHRDF